MRYEAKTSQRRTYPLKHDIIDTIGKTLGERFIAVTDTKEKADLVANALNQFETSAAMDKKEVLGQVLEVQKQLAELAPRLHWWQVNTAEDREAVREDIQKIDGYWRALKESVGL